MCSADTIVENKSQWRNKIELIILSQEVVAKVLKQIYQIILIQCHVMTSLRELSIISHSIELIWTILKYAWIVLLIIKKWESMRLIPVSWLSMKLRERSVWHLHGINSGLKLIDYWNLMYLRSSWWLVHLMDWITSFRSTNGPTTPQGLKLPFLGSYGAMGHKNKKQNTW